MLCCFVGVSESRFGGKSLSESGFLAGIWCWPENVCRNLGLMRRKMKILFKDDNEFVFDDVTCGPISLGGYIT